MNFFELNLAKKLAESEGGGGGGQGGLVLNGKMNITFVNNSSIPIIARGSGDAALYYNDFLRFDPDMSSTENFEILPNESKEFTYFALIKNDEVDEAYIILSDIIWAMGTVEFRVSDTVNCYYEDEAVNMNDLFSVSSCTVTIQDADV